MTAEEEAECKQKSNSVPTKPATRTFILPQSHISKKAEADRLVDRPISLRHFVFANLSLFNEMLNAAVKFRTTFYLFLYRRHYVQFKR